MTQATLTKKLNKTVVEMQDLIRKTKRKLLEFEIIASLAEIKQGKYRVFESAEELMCA